MAAWEIAEFGPVEIETDARCNRKCSYCPVSTQDRRIGQMSADLFAKIISDLREMSFGGTMSFHFYNEPLMDDRLEDFVRLAHQGLPAARLLLFTNGDLLTEARFASLIRAGLTSLRVSLHDAAAEARTIRFRGGLEPSLANRVFLVRYYDQMLPLDNRCGAVRLKPGVRLPNRTAGCHNITSMVIDWQGRVPLCCNDYDVSNPLGDLKASSAKEIWDRSRLLRRDIFLGRYELEACRICTGQQLSPKPRV